jgi:6-phosphogluconolactonase
VDREVMVVDDVAETSVDLFLAAGPRALVLSGGSTPRALYERLAFIEYPWEEVEFFFGDERCVPFDDERSNHRMASVALLSRVAARVYPIDGAECDAQGYERALRERFGDEPWFDLAVYGLGPDGHTASLFPGHPEVHESDRWVVRVPDPGMEPDVPRVTLTVPVLSAATLGVLLVAGEQKREALAKLLDGEDVPAARLTPERLVIVADRAAAIGG